MIIAFVAHLSSVELTEADVVPPSPPLLSSQVMNVRENDLLMYLSWNPGLLFSCPVLALTTTPYWLLRQVPLCPGHLLTSCL